MRKRLAACLPRRGTPQLRGDAVPWQEYLSKRQNFGCPACRSTQGWPWLRRSVLHCAGYNKQSTSLGAVRRGQSRHPAWELAAGPDSGPQPLRWAESGREALWGRASSVAARGVVLGGAATVLCVQVAQLAEAAGLRQEGLFQLHGCSDLRPLRRRGASRPGVARAVRFWGRAQSLKGVGSSQSLGERNIRLPLPWGPSRALGAAGASGGGALRRREVTRGDCLALGGHGSCGLGQRATAPPLPAGVRNDPVLGWRHRPRLGPEQDDGPGAEAALAPVTLNLSTRRPCSS